MNNSLKRSTLILSLFALIFSSCSKQVAFNPLTDPLAAQYVAAKPEKADPNKEILNKAPEKSVVENEKAALENKLANKQITYKHTKKNASALLTKTLNKAKQINKKEIVNKAMQVIPVFASAEKIKKQTAIDGNLRYAIIFFLLALIVGVLANFFGWVFGLLSSILAIIGLVFLVLWILSVL